MGFFDGHGALSPNGALYASPFLHPGLVVATRSLPPFMAGEFGSFQRQSRCSFLAGADFRPDFSAMAQLGGFVVWERLFMTEAL